MAAGRSAGSRGRGRGCWGDAGAPPTGCRGGRFTSTCGMSILSSPVLEGRAAEGGTSTVRDPVLDVGAASVVAHLAAAEAATRGLAAA